MNVVLYSLELKPETHRWGNKSTDFYTQPRNRHQLAIKIQFKGHWHTFSSFYVRIFPLFFFNKKFCLGFKKGNVLDFGPFSDFSWFLLFLKKYTTVREKQSLLVKRKFLRLCLKMKLTFFSLLFDVMNKRLIFNVICCLLKDAVNITCALL